MKKAMGMFGALMIALAMSGVAYAHWSEFLWLDIEVDTGELSLSWSVELFDVWPGNTKFLGTPEEFDVADVGYELVDADGDGDFEGLYLWIYNAYPSLWIDMVIDIHNTGTIPARLYDYSIEEDMYPAGWLWGIDYIDEFVGNWDQIDSGESIYYYLWIHFPQSTPPNAYADFYIDLEFANWNAT